MRWWEIFLTYRRGHDLRNGELFAMSWVHESRATKGHINARGHRARDFSLFRLRATAIRNNRLLSLIQKTDLHAIATPGGAVVSCVTPRGTPE